MSATTRSNRPGPASARAARAWSNSPRAAVHADYHSLRAEPPDDAAGGPRRDHSPTRPLDLAAVALTRPGAARTARRTGGPGFPAAGRSVELAKNVVVEWVMGQSSRELFGSACAETVTG